MDIALEYYCRKPGLVRGARSTDVGIKSLLSSYLRRNAPVNISQYNLPVGQKDIIFHPANKQLLKYFDYKIHGYLLFWGKIVYPSRYLALSSWVCSECIC